jgi:APA family basic amino acid/polyamine antiporter
LAVFSTGIVRRVRAHRHHGEEVKQPERTIPHAIQLALALTVAVYAVIAITILSVLGADGVAGSTSPLADTVQAGSWSWADPVVRVGAGAAALGCCQH